MRYRLLNFTLDLPAGWSEITGELPGEARPTIAKDRGVGALQFSQAEFEEPPEESLTAEDLLGIVRRIAHDADSAIAFDERALMRGSVVVGAVSLAMDGNFVRLWGVSDGRDVVVATYTCDWRDRTRELDEANQLIETIRICPKYAGVA